MGRGDKRTRRGKIFRGTAGKARPNSNKLRKSQENKRRQKKTTAS